LEEARDRVLKDAGCAERKRGKVEKFEHAMANVKETFEVMGIHRSKHQLYQLTFDSLSSIFEDIMDILVLKVRSMKLLSGEMAKHQDLLDELKVTKSLARTKAIIEEIDKINEAEHQMLGFKNRGEDQYKYWKAATFQDELASNPRTKSSFRYYFVCLAGGSLYPCFTAITSKGWRRKHDGEAWKPGQKYYCLKCEAGFKTKWGVICEVIIGEQVYYMRAEVPDEDTLDIQALRAEHKMGGADCKTPKELFDMLPVINPRATVIMQEVNATTGQFTITDREFFQTLPMFKWADVMTFAKGI